MRILKLSAYCYPEQEASSHLTEDLYEAYKSAGFIVENYVPMPTRGVSREVRNEYKRKRLEILYDGHLIIHRFSMFREGRKPFFRAARYLLVNIIQYYKGCNANNIDIIYSGSTPPTQGLLCALVKKRLSQKYGHPVKMIFAIQDIFPDSLVTSGMTKKGSLLWKIGIKISDYAYKNADQIVTISGSMKNNLVKKGIPAEIIEVISNWIDLQSVNQIDREKNSLFDEYLIDRNKFIVLYAGNIGVTQGTDVILHAAQLLKDVNDIQFVIFGGGGEYIDFAENAKELKNVFVHDLLPVERVSQVYSMGDVAIVTCKKGVGTSGMPSKTWSIMACNTPIIASFDLNSDLANILRDSKAGVCVPPGDVELLVNEIYKYYLKWKDGKELIVNSRSYVSKYAEKNACVSRYVELINNCVNG